jgi:hypothetical protein
LSGWLKNCGRRGRRRARLLHGIMSAMSKAFSLVAGVGLGGALAFWGAFSKDPMYVAMGCSLLILAAGNLRFAGFDRQIAELREQRAEAGSLGQTPR